MKKFLNIVILILTITMLVSCKPKEKEVKKDEKNKFDINAATNIVNSYMSYLTKEDIENCTKLYSKDMLKNTKPFSDKELKIKGFFVSEVNEIGRSGMFKVKVLRTNPSKAYSSLDECNIKVVKEEDSYKIGEINNNIDKEAFGEGGQLRIRSKDNVKTNLITDFEGIPSYAFSKEDKANAYKMPVPKKTFGTMIFNYDGEGLGITTKDKDTYIGIIKIDETLAVQGNSDEKGGEEKGGGKKEEGGSKISSRETPIGKQIMNIDLLKDSTVDFLTFSQGGKFLLAQYSKPNYGKCIRVYKTDNGDMIPYVFENSYPIDKVDVIFSSFDKEILNYEVVAKSNTDKAAGEYTGKWQMNLKDFKVKKM